MSEILNKSHNIKEIQITRKKEIHVDQAELYVPSLSKIPGNDKKTFFQE